MSRAARSLPTKDQLRQMTVAELNAYIDRLRGELVWRQGGPVHKVLSKRIEVAVKILELQRGEEASEDDLVPNPTFQRTATRPLN